MEMFVCTSGFQNPLTPTQFTIFVDEWIVLMKALKYHCSPHNFVYFSFGGVIMN